MVETQCSYDLNEIPLQSKDIKCQNRFNRIICAAIILLVSVEMVIKVQYIINIYNGASNFHMSSASLVLYYFTLIGLFTLGILVVSMLIYSLRTIKEYSKGFK